ANYSAFNSNITHPAQAKGYTDQSAMAAAAGYLPYTRSGPKQNFINDLTSMTRMSSYFGMDYPSWSGSMGGAAQLGLVGQKPGDLSSYQNMLAGSYSGIINPSVRMDGYAGGLQDFVRVMSANTFQTPNLTAGANGGLLGIYKA